MLFAILCSESITKMENKVEAKVQVYRCLYENNIVINSERMNSVFYALTTINLLLSHPLYLSRLLSCGGSIVCCWSLGESYARMPGGNPDEFICNPDAKLMPTYFISLIIDFTSFLQGFISQILASQRCILSYF